LCRPRAAESGALRRAAGESKRRRDGGRDGFTDVVDRDGRPEPTESHREPEGEQREANSGDDGRHDPDPRLAERRFALQPLIDTGNIQLLSGEFWGRNPHAELQ